MMSTPGKDRCGLGPLCPGADRRRTGEITADTLALGQWTWSQGRMLLPDSPGDQQCLQRLQTRGACTVTLPPVLCPGEGRAGWHSACRGCPAGMAALGSQREQRPWTAGTGRDPQPEQAESPGKSLLYSSGRGFSREGRLRVSAAARGGSPGQIQGW